MFEKAKPSSNSAFDIYLIYKQALDFLDINDLGDYTKIYSYNRNILTIASDEGIWLQELSLHSEEIKDYINSKNKDSFHREIAVCNKKIVI